MAGILIIPFLFHEQQFLPDLLRVLAEDFQLSTKLGQNEFDASYAYDPSRKQHNSSKLLQGLTTFKENPDARVLGVTDVDLFIPILTYVFGEAQLNGPVAVVSTFRLKPQFYGLPRDDDLVRDRLIKEAVHELGHTFGLRHCPDYECVMTSSTYADELEIKGKAFCSDCTTEMRVNYPGMLKG